MPFVTPYFPMSAKLVSPSGQTSLLQGDQHFRGTSRRSRSTSLMTCQPERPSMAQRLAGLEAKATSSRLCASTPRRHKADVAAVGAAGLQRVLAGQVLKGCRRSGTVAGFPASTLVALHPAQVHLLYRLAYPKPRARAWRRPTGWRGSASEGVFSQAAAASQAGKPSVLARACRPGRRPMSSTVTPPCGGWFHKDLVNQQVQNLGAYRPLGDLPIAASLLAVGPIAALARASKTARG